MRKIDRGEYTEAPEISFGELADRWLKIKEAELRESTFAAYKPAVERLKNFAVEIDKKGNPLSYLKDYKVKRIGPKICDRFKAHLIEQGLHPWTIDRNITIMKAIFEKGVQWEYLYKNPAAYVEKPPIPEAEVAFLTPEEFSSVLGEVDEFYRVMVLTVCMTGLRLSEVLGLSWEDVDTEGCRIHVRKTFQKGRFLEPKTKRSKRTVAIARELAEILKVHRLEQTVALPSNTYDLVFTDEDGYPLNTNKLAKRILRPAFAQAKVKEPKKPFHALRHSYVSLLAKQREDIKFIQQQVGHSSAKVTWDIYSHLYPGTEREAMERFAPNFRTAIEQIQKKEGQTSTESDPSTR